jgi:hypothetical protein
VGVLGVWQAARRIGLFDGDLGAIEANARSISPSKTTMSVFNGMARTHGKMGERTCWSELSMFFTVNSASRSIS